jgi:hypothetical protein
MTRSSNPFRINIFIQTSQKYNQPEKQHKVFMQVNKYQPSMGSQQSHTHANNDEEEDANPQFIKNIQTSVPFAGPSPSQSTGPSTGQSNRARAGTCTNFSINPTKTSTTNYPTQDSVVNSVIEQFAKRSNVGVEKYGTTLDRTDLTMLDWIQHAQEELMDGILYLEKIKKTMLETQKIRASPPMIR